MRTLSITRRQALVGASTTAILATLAACSGKDDKSSGGKVEINYWHRLPDKDGMTKVQTVVDQWNKENPNIHVNVKKFDGQASESYAKIAQAVKAGNAPDLAQVGYGEIASVYLEGSLEDVAKEIKAAGYEKHFAAGPMGQCKLGDVVVGLPQDTGPLVYVYDKAAFDAIGIKAPTTWAELKEAAKKAKEKGKYIATWQQDEVGYQISGQAAAAGAHWYKPEGDKWKVEVTDAASKKVATFLQELNDEGLALKLADGRWGKEWIAKLKDGTIIGTVAAGWEPGFMLGDLGKDATSWQVTYLPTEDGKKVTGADGGSAVAVIKGCKHKEEALKFADWINTQVPALVSQGLVVAATTAKPETPAAMKKLWGGQDVYGFLAEANNTMVTDFPYIPTWFTVTEKMKEPGGKVTSGSAKVEDVLTTAQTVSVSTLKEKNIGVA